MSDRYSAEIIIGSTIDESIVSELIKELNDAGVDISWGESLDGLKTVIDLKKLLKTKKWTYLHFTDDQARYGCFEGLEGWLCEHNIEWDRQSSGYCEYEPCKAYWRRGMQRAEEHTATNDGDFLVNARFVQYARKALVVGNVAAALKYLDDVVRDLQPYTELKPVKFVK